MNPIPVCGLCMEWKDRDCPWYGPKSFNTIACLDRYQVNPAAVEAATNRKKEVELSMRGAKKEITPEIGEIILNTFDVTRSVNQAAKAAGVWWEDAKKYIVGSGRQINPATGGKNRVTKAQNEVQQKNLPKEDTQCNQTQPNTTEPVAETEQEPAKAVHPVGCVCHVCEEEQVLRAIDEAKTVTVDTYIQQLKQDNTKFLRLSNEAQKTVDLITTLLASYPDKTDLSPVVAPLMELYHGRVAVIQRGDVA